MKFLLYNIFEIKYLQNAKPKNEGINLRPLFCIKENSLTGKFMIKAGNKVIKETN